MNLLTRYAAPAALALAALSTAALAQGKQDFVLTNATGYDIAEVYVSPADTDNWEEDVMGADILTAGDYVTINFSARDKACHYDLKVVWTDGDEATWDNFNLCALSAITLHWDNGRAWADYE